MILDDLDRPRLFYRIRWWTLAVVALVCFGYAFYTERKNAHLTSAIVELVDMLDAQLTSTQARISRLGQVQRESIQALLEGGPRAYVEMLAKETDQ